jgi:hypothetical protein
MRLSALIAMGALLATPAMAQSNGDIISGFLYGNTSNERPSGHGVLPSLAPGPWACVYELGECQGDETNAGVSVGELIGQGEADFANGKDPGPGFGKKK